jgi:hypothetical protein
MEAKTIAQKSSFFCCHGCCWYAAETDSGADRGIFGFDVGVGRADFSHQIDSKCMSVLPNPCDFNLFMVQTG